MPEVIVIGGANVDVKGRPDAPLIAATSNPGTVVTSVGGVGRNIAHNLASLGIGVGLIAAVGADANGRQVREETARAGVDISLVETVAAPTGIYLVLLDDRGEVIAAVNDMRCVDLLTPAHLEAREAALAGAGLLVADCNLPSACLAWIVRYARDQGKRLVIEPVSVPKAAKLLDLGELPAAFAITPNLDQLASLGGSSDRAAALARLHRLGIENVVVHRGAQGALVSEATGRTTAIAARHVAAVRDVTGAGDAAVAGLVCGLVEDLDIVAAARLGQAAAALKLQSAESVATGLNRDRLRTQMAEGT